jgi:molybdopterin-guanine dinucleotide biosynthesis protein B
VERLVTRLRAAGQRVSVIKHAHHEFDIDQPGKDSWRHRQAGAFEVLIASSRRLALIREHAAAVEPNLETLLPELSPCDWVMVEGFKQATLPKLEVWRAALGKPVRYPEDPWVLAVCTDDAARLPEPTTLPVLDLNDVDAVLAFVLKHAARFERLPAA